MLKIFLFPAIQFNTQLDTYNQSARMCNQHLPYYNFISTYRIMKQAHQSCQNLLRECQVSSNYCSQPRLKQNNSMSQLHNKISTSKMLSKISPQQQQQNDRIINRMRSKYHRKQKQSSIKKTDLGEDLLTFTPEQLQKLQFIDQCQHKHILYRETLDPPDEENVDKMTAVDRLRKMGRLDDILDEIRNNLKWGEVGEGQQKKFYIKVKNGKGFLKRGGQHLNTMVRKLVKQHKQQRSMSSAKHSLQKYFHALLNKNSFKRSFLNSGPIWGKQPNVSLSFAEKVQLIREQAAKNLQKMTGCSPLYMTEQRRNALYECQVLRLSKKVLGNIQFEKLQYSLSEKENDVQCQELDEKSVQNQSNNCEAEEILDKNYRRIKEERKRVIQKLLC